MATVDDLKSLIQRINGELDDWHNFYEHTKTVWRTFQQMANDGLKLTAENETTGQKYTAQDLVGLSQYYMTEILAPFALQKFSSTFESFISDFLRILLFRKPGVLGKKSLSLGDVIKAGAVTTLISDAIEEKLNQIRYEKVKDWFEFVDSVQKLGCPAADEIERVAEIKATRDIIEHNSGIVNKIYLGKAGAKSRFKEGDNIEVADTYLRESWELLKKICNDMTNAAQRLLP
jgi:hypothetical protein